jgi:hypothetical protein
MQDFYLGLILGGIVGGALTGILLLAAVLISKAQNTDDKP